MENKLTDSQKKVINMITDKIKLQNTECFNPKKSPISSFPILTEDILIKALNFDTIKKSVQKMRLNYNSISDENLYHGMVNLFENSLIKLNRDEDIYYRNGYTIIWDEGLEIYWRIKGYNDGEKIELNIWSDYLMGKNF